VASHLLLAIDTPQHGLHFQQLVEKYRAAVILNTAEVGG
jgi:hypothetical protein